MQEVRNGKEEIAAAASMRAPLPFPFPLVFLSSRLPYKTFFILRLSFRRRQGWHKPAFRRYVRRHADKQRPDATNKRRHVEAVARWSGRVNFARLISS